MSKPFTKIAASLKKQNFYGGFTLIEILVVIVIIGILATIIITNMVMAREKALENKVFAEVSEANKAAISCISVCGFDCLNTPGNDVDVCTDSNGLSHKWPNLVQFGWVWSDVNTGSTTGIWNWTANKGSKQITFTNRGTLAVVDTGGGEEEPPPPPPPPLPEFSCSYSPPSPYLLSGPTNGTATGTVRVTCNDPDATVSWSSPKLTGISTSCLNLSSCALSMNKNILSTTVQVTAGHSSNYQGTPFSFAWTVNHP